MSIEYKIYKQEASMTEAKLKARCQALGVELPYDQNLEFKAWSGTVSNYEDAQKLDIDFVTLELPRSAVETLLSYPDAVGNDDWALAINHIRDAYTKRKL